MKNHTDLSLTIQRDLIISKELNASDLASACYRQIERLNPTLNAFITVIHPEIDESPPLESKLLYGIPIAVKDLYDTKASAPQAARNSSG